MNKRLTDIEKDLNKTSDLRVQVQKDYDQEALIVKNILLRYPAKTTKDEEHFTAWVGFKKLLADQGLLVPDISLLGNLKYGNENTGGYAQFKLFSGLGSSKVGTTPNEAAAFFVPEASSFGFSGEFALGFKMMLSPELQQLRKKDTKDVAFKTGFSFLSKSIKTADTSFSTNLMHLKFGLEVLPFKDVSVRANINGLSCSSQNVMLAKYYQNVNATKWYVDVGISTLLDFVPSKDFKIFFDLNIIPVNNTIRQFTGITDKVITQIKAELRKNF